jgi:hypothetical protein
VRSDTAGATGRAGRDVDDPAPGPGTPMRQDFPGAQEDGFLVDLDCPVGVGFGQVVDATAKGNPGVVDQNVDRAEVRSDRSHHGGDCCLFGAKVTIFRLLGPKS